MSKMSSPSPATEIGDHYSTHYDRLGDEPLSVAIADAVAIFLNEDVTELEPIHYSINADALERLFEPRANGLRSTGSVTFEYSECRVTVTGDGEIRIKDS
ncbi:HalOD1 output domain-containing protein [Haloarchaeobius amylolyticus]|uniref:HalOD1 output domain-containing protein n=1 Tax=Haloarchaeobius amylolyticus TaxID=1198296 RepID=A0ABD6BGS9_9EURY